MKAHKFAVSERLGRTGPMDGLTEVHPGRLTQTGVTTKVQRIGAIDTPGGVDTYYLVTASGEAEFLHHRVSVEFTDLVCRDGLGFCQQVTVQPKRFYPLEFICIAHFRRDI